MSPLTALIATTALTVICLVAVYVRGLLYGLGARSYEPRHRAEGLPITYDDGWSL